MVSLVYHLQVLRLHCSVGVHLPFAFLRAAQIRIVTGQWIADSIFFTEADQVVYARDVEALQSALGDFVYLAPSRLNQVRVVHVALRHTHLYMQEVCGGAGPASPATIGKRLGARGGANQGNCSTALNAKAIASNLALRVRTIV